MQFMDLGIHLCTVCKYWDVDQPWVQLHVLMCNKQRCVMNSHCQGDADGTVGSASVCLTKLPQQ